MRTFKILPKWWPFKAVSLFLWVFVRRGDNVPLSPALERHERIHLAQQRELLWIPFIILYAFEFLIRWVGLFFQWKRAYRAISFEQEAYAKMDEENYLKTRPNWAWINYLGKDLNREWWLPVGLFLLAVYIALDQFFRSIQ